MALISLQDQQTIRQWASGHTSAATLQLARGENGSGENLKQFCDEFIALAPHVQLRQNPDAPFCAPAILLGRHGNIAYQALPLDRELPPFLEALNRAALADEMSEAQSSALAQIELPAELSLYIAPHCPHCPLVVGRLLTLAHRNPPIRLTIIDGTLFTGQATAQDIRSVPTLILDNQLRWTGQIDTAEVIDQCARRDPSQLSAGSLRQIIEAGEASRVATMMIEAQRIFPAIIELLVHPRWSVRLGAMVTVEYLTDEAPHLSVRLIAPLWQRFQQLDEPIQVDIVQVMAQVGLSSARDYLEKIVSGDYGASVKEAALEELSGSV